MELTNINIKVEITENGIGNIVVESKTRELLKGTRVIGESINNRYHANRNGEFFVEKKVSGEVVQRVPGTNSYGYPVVQMNGKVEYIHRLVATAFISTEIPKGTQVDHISGVKTDFSVNNLRFVTPQMNIRYAFKNGLINTRKLTNEQVLDIKQLYRTGQVSQMALAKEYGVSQQTISKVVNDLSYQF